jgi:membrane-associated phospholipid phosphatase
LNSDLFIKQIKRITMVNPVRYQSQQDQDAAELESSGVKSMGWDERVSRQIFASDFGCFLNYVAYVSSCVFMEELCVITLAGLYFLLFQRNNKIALGYIACFVGNLLIALVAKKLIAKPRPNLAEIPSTTKSTFFRKKQSFNASSPSGDTVQSTNLVVFVALCLPSWAFWCVLPLGLMVPASRVYLCCHWISDTLAGMAFGTVVTCATIGILRHWNLLEI